MDLDAVMAGLSLNKDNLSYDSILRLQQLLAEGMKLHDPAQAESMREMLKKMRVSLNKNRVSSSLVQNHRPKPRRTPREGDRSTARRGALLRSMPTRRKRSKGSCSARLLHHALQEGSRWARRPRNRPRRTSATNACRRDRPSPKAQSRSRRRPSTSARRPNREPLALWILSRPWTLRTCPPVHLILVHQLRHENHQDGRRAGPNQDKRSFRVPSDEAPGPGSDGDRGDDGRQVRAGAFLVGEEEEQTTETCETRRPGCFRCVRRSRPVLRARGL